jgi:hypothetical protein
MAFRINDKMMYVYHNGKSDEDLDFSSGLIPFIGFTNTASGSDWFYFGGMQLVR